MEKSKHLVLFVVCALVISMMAMSVYAADKPVADKPAVDKPVTVKGVVEASAKDAAGKVTAVQIVAGADKVNVAADAKGKELLALVGKTVEATGKVTTEKDGSKTIAVEAFTVAQ